MSSTYTHIDNITLDHYERDVNNAGPSELPVSVLHKTFEQNTTKKNMYNQIKIG